MEPKYLNVYAHSDCSGGLVHVRSGPSVNYDSLRSCAAGVETATHTSQFMEGRQYMQIRREYATDVVLDGTCVPTGLAPRLFAFVNCSAMTHALYTDANCSHLVPVVDITSPQVECSVLNDVAVSSMPLPPPALKYLKRFENADCTGVLTYVATLSGVVAIAHDTQSCVNAFELNLIPPRWKDYAHDSSYMHLTNYDSDDDHAHSLVLHGACVEFSPRKYVVVDCYAQTITHYADESCQTLDLHANSPPVPPPDGDPKRTKACYEDRDDMKDLSSLSLDDMDDDGIGAFGNMDHDALLSQPYQAMMQSPEEGWPDDNDDDNDLPNDDGLLFDQGHAMGVPLSYSAMSASAFRSSSQEMMGWRLSSPPLSTASNRRISLGPVHISAAIDLPDSSCSAANADTMLDDELSAALSPEDEVQFHHVVYYLQLHPKLVNQLSRRQLNAFRAAGLLQIEVSARRRSVTITREMLTSGPMAFMFPHYKAFFSSNHVTFQWQATASGSELRVNETGLPVTFTPQPVDLAVEFASWDVLTDLVADGCQMLHVACAATSSALILEDGRGGAFSVDVDQLTRLFRGSAVQVVQISVYHNGCPTAHQLLLDAGVPYVVAVAPHTRVVPSSQLLCFSTYDPCFISRVSLCKTQLALAVTQYVSFRGTFDGGIRVLHVKDVVERKGAQHTVVWLQRMFMDIKDNSGRAKSFLVVLDGVEVFFHTPYHAVVVLDFVPAILNEMPNVTIVATTLQAVALSSSPSFKQFHVGLDSNPGGLFTVHFHALSSDSSLDDTTRLPHENYDTAHEPASPTNAVAAAAPTNCCIM
ncbi:hypothetical protein DYB38_006424 [Aphanomyces astaci]|uniref:Uncharacterized protein n=1 Tax=Aphanomyces astaci TaxID=112090 RepID=A0A397CS68_APHAT|nr:hypothetical protein DYB38_006424 [Aphanomyces astaci]